MAKAKFDIGLYGDNLIDYYRIKANKYVSYVEAGIMKAVYSMVYEAYTIQKVNEYWTNRTWNLLSSLFAVVFYDGKVLGRETSGYKVKNPKRKAGSHSSNLSDEKRGTLGMMNAVNPVFGYQFTGRGMAEWRGDDKDHYPYYGGFAYANKSVREIQRKYRLSMLGPGYTVVVGFGMPYGYSPKPESLPMKERTGSLIDRLIGNLREQLNAIDPNIGLRVTTGDYKTSRLS